MAQKQKWFLIIAGLIFLGSAFYLAHGFAAKAQTTCSAKGVDCVDSNSCCNTSDQCQVYGDNTTKKCCDSIPGQSYLHGFNTCCGYEYLFVGPNEWRCVKNKIGQFTLGEYCTENAQCASKNCCNNQCISVSTRCPSNICFSAGEGCIPSDINNNCCSPYGCDPLDNICKPIPAGGFPTPSLPPVNLPLGSLCDSNSQCISGNCINGQCQSTSPIGPGNPPSSSLGFLVVYPNGGESLQIGQTYQIKWSAQVVPNAVDIKIWNYDYPDQTAPQAFKFIGSNVKGVVGATDQTGTNLTYPWEIQAGFFESYGTWRTTDRLKVIITEKRSDGLPASQGSSNTYFNVVPAPPPPAKQCSDCGNGVLNLCNKDECLSIEPHCVFYPYLSYAWGNCDPGGCVNDSECASQSCQVNYAGKCDTQNRRCKCNPIINEQKIPFKITVNEGSALPGGPIAGATVKVFDLQGAQVGSCVAGQDGTCSTNELVPIGYGSLAFPSKTYHVSVSAPTFFTNSTVQFNATLNMAPVSVALYRDAQTTFKTTIDLYNRYEEITSGGVVVEEKPFFGVSVGVSKRGNNTILNSCLSLNPPQKCSFDLAAGQYTAFVTDYHFCSKVDGCFTDFEITDSDKVVKLVTKMQETPGSPSPRCSRTDGGDIYTKGAIRYLTSAGGVSYAIDHCVSNSSLAYAPALEGPFVTQYDCNGWPTLSACSAGCYDGACLIDCAGLSNLGGSCVKESSLATICGTDEIVKQPLNGSFCDKSGGDTCAFCSKSCTTKSECSYLNCPYNYTRLSEAECSINNKCFCRDLSCSQDSECSNITCQAGQTKICEVKNPLETPAKPKECLCLNNTSQRRILAHTDDSFTTEDLPDILVTIIDTKQGNRIVASCTTDARGKCTIPAITFSPDHAYKAVVRGIAGYKDAEISLASRTDAIDYVSANFHLLSSDPSIIACSSNSSCANFPCASGENPTCYNDRCVCQSGTPVVVCSTDSDCASSCQGNARQVCQNNLCTCLGIPALPGGGNIDNTQDTTISLTVNGGQVRMIIPKETFTENVSGEIETSDFSLSNIAQKVAMLSSDGLVVGGRLFDFSIKDASGNEIHNFAKPITIKIPYTDSQISGANEDSLRIYIFNEGINNWEALPTTIDKQNKILTATTMHFTSVAVLITQYAPGKSTVCLPCCTASDCGDATKYECSGADNTAGPNKCSRDTEGSSYVFSGGYGQCQVIGQPVFCSLSTFDDPEKLINSITKWIFYLAIVIAPLMILLGAFYMLTAGGEPRRSTQGKTIITWALIGLGVILAAKAFISIITSILK